MHFACVYVYVCAYWIQKSIVTFSHSQPHMRFVDVCFFFIFHILHFAFCVFRFSRRLGTGWDGKGMEWNEKGGFVGSDLGLDLL